jgi:diacylglycerol O-acyltransferase
MESTLQERLGAFDAVMWNVEANPYLRSVIVAMIVLDAPPDEEVARERIERMTLAVPKLRQRVVGNPVSLVAPRWEVDPNFDLDFHFQQVKAPRKEKTLRPALRVAENMAGQDFDRHRPLWKIMIVTGLADDKAAIIVKIHHGITDGVGGMMMAASLFDITREPNRELGEKPEAPEGKVLSIAERLNEGIVYDARQVATNAKNATVGLAGLAAKVARNPKGFAGDAKEFAASAQRMLAPANEPLSPVMTERSLSAHFDFVEADFATLRKAAKSNGVTINTAFMTIVSGALRRYHDRHNGVVPALRVNMPVNLRTPDDDDAAVGGNRWVPARFPVPIEETDPAQRMKQLNPLLRQAATEPALVVSEPVYRLLVRLPTAAATSISAGMMLGTDFAATNVPGPPIKIYAAGAEVVQILPFAPRGGAAVNIAFMSYAGKAIMTVNIDTAAIPDTQAFMNDIKSSLKEVLELGA